MKCSRGQLRSNGACCARANARVRFQLRTALKGREEGSATAVGGEMLKGREEGSATAVRGEVLKGRGRGRQTLSS